MGKIVTFGGIMLRLMPPLQLLVSSIVSPVVLTISPWPRWKNCKWRSLGTRFKIREQNSSPYLIKAPLAPCPWRRLMPTGGLDAIEEDVKGRITGGATALGLSSKLITRQRVVAHNFEGNYQKGSAGHWLDS